MKPKKSPVPLITALVVVIGIAFVANQSFNKTYGTPEELQQRQMEEMQAKMASQKPAPTAQPTAASSQELSSAIGKAATGGKPSAMDREKEGDERQMKGQQILVPDETTQPKPKPNDSAVAGQWWEK